MRCHVERERGYRVEDPSSDVAAPAESSDT